MAQGHEERQDILDYNLPTIKAKIATMPADHVLVLIDVTDKNGKSIHLAQLVSEGATLQQAKKTHSTLVASVPPNHRPTLWMEWDRSFARGLLKRLAGGSAGFDIAEGMRTPNQRLVSVIAEGGHCFANVALPE